MKLTTKEKEIIEKFKRRIEDRFPDEILKILVFGSKARGDATEKSDIDIIVVTSSDDWRKGDEIREIGYGLDEEINYKLSIQVIPESHISYLKHNNFQFIKNIEAEGITI
ncbi:MAG: nucleotidyltransferase domain-containing protein [Deltaproteobacteria bacterium]|nr:nucleotidyltransferase domain-containing protein [Deltaproteobacteria bacterium]